MDTYNDDYTGYYLATFEAAVQHIHDLAHQYEDIMRNDGFYVDTEEDIFDFTASHRD
jgi:hypothetical protein